jgi:hypothetical protein
MRVIVNVVSLLSLVAGTLIASAARAAETLQAPPVVMAQPDGQFSYEIALRKGPGAATFGGVMYLGMDNVDASLFGDGFCLSTVEEGQVIRETVTGHLRNPNLPGKVFESVSLCGGGGGDDSTTVIRPFSALDAGASPVAADRQLWNDPNPFSRRTTFHFSMAGAGNVELTIHDVAGRLVARLVDGVQSAGSHEVPWELPAGPDAAFKGNVLFARLRVGGASFSQRLVLLR